MNRDEIRKLAAEAFDKQERVKMMGIQATPQEYEDRRASAVEYAIAIAEANEAKMKLRAATGDNQ